jgi:hypothetical protein
MNQEEANLLYGRVGMIVALSQMIEYNLAEIQAYCEALNNLSKKPSPTRYPKANLKRSR